MRVMAFVRHSHVTGISAINYYRAISPLQHLSKRNDFDVEILGQEEIRGITENGESETLLGRDLYLTSRLFAGRAGRHEFIDVLHQHGGKVVFDTDDDLTDEYRKLGRGEDFKGVLRDVDYVTVSTPYLRDCLAPYTKHVPVVLPNHVDAKWFSGASLGSERKYPGLTIGFIGTASHYDDWKFPMEALHRLATEYEGICILAAGYAPDYLRALPNFHELDPVPYVMYPSLMRQFDIVCCSLDAEDGFNKSKSSIKALESMAAARVLPNGKIGGAVPVCTNMKVYRRTVQNKHNGLLTDNDHWYETLSHLIDDRLLRQRLAMQGLTWVTKNRDIRQGHRKWGLAYQKMMEGRI